MFLLIVRVLIFALIILLAVRMINKIIKLNKEAKRKARQEKIDKALEEQKLAAELAQKVQQLNPEEINNNNTKVKTTLDSIKE